jgi:hypothetical protein
LFLAATLPEYGLEWPVGEDRLLIVSIGTGSSTAAHISLSPRQVNLLFNAKNLPSVFMNGASIAQDMLCRSIGLCRAGPEIDHEFGSRLNQPGVAGKSLFTFVRYNADLSDDGLISQGFVDRRQRKALRRLDAVKSVPALEAIGRRVGESADFDGDLEAFPLL